MASERISHSKSDEINKALSKLNYEKVDEVFELINQFKIPVFVEFDQGAINIWKSFETLSKKSQL